MGLDVYLAKHVKKGSDGKLYQKFINAHTGKEELVDSVTAAKSIVTTIDQMNAKTKSVFALGGRNGVRIVPKKDVDYYLPRPDDAYSMASNLVVMPSGVKEMRLMMGCLHPMTNMVVIGKHNEIDIIPAMKLAADYKDRRLPGSSEDGDVMHYDIRNVLYKWPGGPKWFRKVVLRSGRTLITSKDHKWSILRDGKVVLTTADKLRKGDKVLRSAFTNLPNRRVFLNSRQLEGNGAFLLGQL